MNRENGNAWIGLTRFEYWVCLVGGTLTYFSDLTHPRKDLLLKWESLLADSIKLSTPLDRQSCRETPYPNVSFACWPRSTSCLREWYKGLTIFTQCRTTLMGRFHSSTPSGVCCWICIMDELHSRLTPNAFPSLPQMLISRVFPNKHFAKETSY